MRTNILLLLKITVLLTKQVHKKFIDWQYKEYMNNKYKDSVIFNTDVVHPEKIAKEILKNCEK